MLIVAPSGSTKLETSSDTPSFSSQRSIVTGSVAPDDDVEKATSWAGPMPAKKSRMPTGVNALSMVGYTTTVWMAKPDEDGRAVHAEAAEQAERLGGVAARDRRDGRGDEREHAERRHLHDEVHQADHDLVEALEEGEQRPGLVLGHLHEADAEQDRHDDDLEHVAVRGRRGEEVVRHHVHEKLERPARLGRARARDAVRRDVRVARHELVAEARRDKVAGAHEVHHDEPEHDRDGRRGEVDADRLAADARELPQVREGRHARDEAREHERHGDKLEPVDEDGPEWGDVGRDEGGLPAERRREAERDAEREADDDLPVSGPVPGHRAAVW